MRSITRRSLIGLVGWLASGLVACGAGDAARTAPSPTLAAPAPTSAPSPRSGAPTVVVFVVDQLGSWVLEKHFANLDEDGAIRRAATTGVYVERVAYPYASTNTAPGHAAIFTGHPPAITGVTANSLFEQGQGERAFVSDGTHRVLGHDGAFVSPVALRAPTVAEALYDATGGKAHIVGISGKDRATVLSVGRHADLALWYDHAVPGFTTSTFYAEALPPAIDGWLRDHPLAALLTPWTAERPDLYASQWGPDDGPGEGNWIGSGTVFPHDPMRSPAPYSLLRTMPALTEYMLELAAFAADEAGLGADDVPDLLIVSVSGTDYVGHTFGPTSWEMADHLVRADRAMGKLVRHLEKRGPVAALITADHGVAGLPESDPRTKLRLFPDVLEKAAEAAVDKALGAGDWVAAFSRPFIYLQPELEGERKKQAITAIQKALTAIDGIEGVYLVDEAMTWRADPDPLKRAVGQSVTTNAGGELYVMVSDGCIIDESRPTGKGTTHGSPYPYDTEVPVLFWGPGVAPNRLTDTLPQGRVAPTISALLGVAPPAGVTAAPLPGAPAPVKAGE